MNVRNLLIFLYFCIHIWLRSLVNRASDSGSEGRAFESHRGHKERNSLCMNTLQRESFFIQYIQKSQPYGSLSCYNFHRGRGMKQIIFIFAMLMIGLSYAGKPEGRSERRTDMKPMKEIYLAGGCFWGTEHFLKQIEGVELPRWDMPMEI